MEFPSPDAVRADEALTGEVEQPLPVESWPIPVMSTDESRWLPRKHRQAIAHAPGTTLMKKRGPRHLPQLESPVDAMAHALDTFRDIEEI